MESKEFFLCSSEILMNSEKEMVEMDFFFMPQFLFRQILLDRSPLRWEFSRQVTCRLAFSILPWGFSSFCPLKVKVMAMITGGGHILNSAQAVEKDYKRLDTTKTAIQLMEDILHLGSLSPCLQGSSTIPSG